MRPTLPILSLLRSLPILMLSAICAAAAVSDPLDLEQALQNLDAHPRAGASPDLEARLPRRQSLYLNCQRLAFNSSQVADPRRNQPLDALITPLAARQLEVLERFFDVLLADMRFASDSEAMAVAYVQFDRASVRSDLGQLSQLRVLELETVYQDFLQRRTASEISQRLTRSLLAQALGHPETLPRGLLIPILPPLRLASTLDDLFAKAMKSQAVRALGDGRNQADHALIELELRQQILELLLRLQALAAVERSARAESAWRDLKLDESRTLYDQEVTADLGYSMSQQTRTRLLEQRVAYCRVLAWAELNALTDQPLWTHAPEDP